MEKTIKLKNKIRQSKKIRDFVYSEEWRELIDPDLADQFSKHISLAMCDKENQIEHLANTRAIYNLCDTLGKKINLGEKAKKQLKELQNKR